jgi:hypothetical protein
MNPMGHIFLKSTRVAVFAVAAVFGVAERAVLAEPDSLKVLLEKPRCKEWRAVSRVTRDRLRKSVATGEAMDLKLVELAFTLMDYCAGEMEVRLNARIEKFESAGLSGGGESAQRAAQAYAALIAYYKEALSSSERATALKNWPYLAQAANKALGDLLAIVDRKFGEGAFLRYRSIAAKPAQSRTEAEQKEFAAMRPWLEPL